MSGIVYYSRGRWEPRFNYWHPIKPLMAAATGSVACLLIIVLLRAAAGTKNPTIDSTTLDAAAFIFGFAESPFRQLIAAVTDVFLKPGKTKPPGGPPGGSSAPPLPPPSPPGPPPSPASGEPDAAVEE